MSFEIRNLDAGQHNIQDVLAVMDAHPEVLFIHAAGNVYPQDPGKIGEGVHTADRDFSAHVRPNLIHIAAGDARGMRADYSNWGPPYVELAIRGDIYSSVLRDGYERMRGTSMAAPAIANIAAKAKLLDPELDPASLKKLLTLASDPSEAWRDVVTSGGLVNPSRALTLAALSGMVRRGDSAEVAADKLGLSGEDRGELLRMQAELRG
jgi:subtilisin family serine protease